MSIITDTLDRLQAERARSLGQPHASATTDSAEAVNFRGPDLSFPHPLVRSLRNRLPFLMVGLGGIGIAAYLWGLPLISAPDKVMTEQGAIKALNPVQSVPPQSVEPIPEEGGEGFTGANAPENDRPAESASAPDPAAGVLPVAQEVPARKPRSSPVVRPTAKPSPAGNVGTPSFDERKHRVSALLRDVTPLLIRLARAQHLIQQRRYARAAAVLQPLFVEPPDLWEPWFWLGTAQLGLRQLEKARTSLVEGLARDATVPQLWVQRALVSQQQGRFGEALDALRQAELLAPKLPEVHLNLAYALEVEGNRLLAVKHYRTFLILTERKSIYHPTRRKVLDRISRLSKT